MAWMEELYRNTFCVEEETKEPKAGADCTGYSYSAGTKITRYYMQIFSCTATIGNRKVTENLAAANTCEARHFMYKLYPEASFVEVK